MPSPPRRFPALWIVAVKTEGGYRVDDASGRMVGWFTARTSRMLAKSPAAAGALQHATVRELRDE
jgi:hypothetical protein